MKILDLEIENDSYDAILNRIQNNISLNKSFSFSYVNAYVALFARKDLTLRNDLNKLSGLYSDGIGMYISSKFLWGKNGLRNRINATDLHYKILDLAQKNDYKVFFFGGGEKAISLLADHIKKHYPNLTVSGIMERNLNFDTHIFSEIISTDSDILFVGLGTPYQEKWIAKFGKKINVPVQIAVGSWIDFLAGKYNRAPKVMRIIGLEWLFRLFSEPKRLWKRYLLGIPHFVFLIIKQKLFTKESL